MRTFIGVWATVACLALLCSSCATKLEVTKAHELETKQDYKGAYGKILDGLKASPKNKELLAQKTRLGELYAEKLQQEAAHLPTNNLVERVELLQQAENLGSTNHTAISTALRSLKDQRAEIHKRADNLAASTNLAEMVAGTEALSEYIKFDPELTKKLIENSSVSAHVEALLLQLAAGNDPRRLRTLALRSREIWHTDTINRTGDRITAQLRQSGLKALIPTPALDASLGCKTVTCFIGALLAPGTNETSEAYLQACERLQEALLPTASFFGDHSG